MSLWDGVVMGGGVGISIHGTFRVATETSLFAMPETGSFHLSDTLGSYLVARDFRASWHGFFVPFKSCTDCRASWHGFWAFRELH